MGGEKIPAPRKDKSDFSQEESLSPEPFRSLLTGMSSEPEGTSRKGGKQKIGRKREIAPESIAAITIAENAGEPTCATARSQAALGGSNGAPRRFLRRGTDVCSKKFHCSEGKG